jgi:hypothetical protein
MVMRPLVVGGSVLVTASEWIDFVNSGANRGPVDEFDALGPGRCLHPCTVSFG